MSGEGKGSDPVGGSMRLLRIGDVAGRLSISRSMAHELVAHGELRSIKIGRAVRVKPEDLSAFIEAAVREG